MSIKYQIIESLTNRDSMIHEDMSSIIKTNNKIIYDKYTVIEFELKATKRDYSELNSSVMINRYMILSFVGNDKVAVVDLHYKSLQSYHCIGFMYTFNCGSDELNRQCADSIRSAFNKGKIEDIGDFSSLIVNKEYEFYSHVGFDGKNRKFLDVSKVINTVESSNKAVLFAKEELSKSNLKENKDYTFTYGVFSDINSNTVYIENTIKFISNNEVNTSVYDTLCGVLRDCEIRGQCSRLLRLRDEILFNLYINGDS